MEIIKTIPESELNTARDTFRKVGEEGAEAKARADLARIEIIRGLIKYATDNGIAPKVAAACIMQEVVKPCTRTKAEQQKYQDMHRAGIIPPKELSGMLAYSTGAAYAKSIEIAMIKSKPFAVSLYAASLTENRENKANAHAQKILAAEAAAKEAATKAKTLATKAARSKSVEAKLAAEQAKLEAVKAQEAVRAVIDKAPVSKKTGGKVAKKAGPVKALTRHEVALHATALVAMLRSIGEECADEIADILADNNLLVK